MKRLIPNSIDFGKRSLNSNLETSISNNSIYYIVGVDPDCGCTIANFSPKLLTLRITFTKEGDFNKYVKVTFSDNKTETIELKAIVNGTI